MSSAKPGTKPSKLTSNATTTSFSSSLRSSSPSSSSSSSSSHIAMVELKQRIITSLSKLADRDTHQIAVDDLQNIIFQPTISPETLPIILNCLYDSINSNSNSNNNNAVKKESLRLLTLICRSHTLISTTHLSKIISHVVKRLKDSDSGVKDACRDAIGSLSGQFLTVENVSFVGLFAKPLFEAMAEQNKGLQAGAASCMAKMIESAAGPPVAAFQKLCPRICKLLNSPNFLAKAALLPVVSSLAQVGAIAPQSLESLLQSIHECLQSTDWATRKAAADALIALASLPCNLIQDKADSTLTVIDACRFDKIKPVRDSMTEALNLWKKIAGKGEDGAPDDQKALTSEQSKSEKQGEKNANPGERTELLAKDSYDGSSNNSDSVSKGKTGSIPEKAAVILKKKSHALTDKEPNPEFFRRLAKRGSGEFPVEVVVPRRGKSSSNSHNEDESETNDSESRGRSNCLENGQEDDHGCSKTRYQNLETVTGLRNKQPDFGDYRTDINRADTSGNYILFSKTDSHFEGSFMSDKGNWSAIQRQLLHLERQQAHLMNMLQDFMGGSHDGMVTLEKRVRGLERVIEDMASELSISSGRRGNFSSGFEDFNRPSGKYNSFPDYYSATYNGRVSYGERFVQSNGITSGMRGRGPAWRSDIDDCEFPAYATSRNGQIGTRKARESGPADSRSPKSENETEQAGSSSSRRAWDKGNAPVRLGEGPSARSVWQASKDEATLEAIRVAGEDTGISQAGRAGIPEAEALVREKDALLSSWSNAMRALRVGDTDSAYAEVLSTKDDILLVKLMDRTGPVVDQLSNGVGNQALHAIGQFLLDHNLFDICLSWIQQLLEVVLEKGPDALGIPMELKEELLVNLHEASPTDPPEDWNGATPDQLLVQLASAWGIELQQFDQ